MSTTETVAAEPTSTTTITTTTPQKRHRIYNFTAETFKYANDGDDNNNDDYEVYWTVPSSGELLIKQSKTRKLPVITAVRYENVVVNGTVVGDRLVPIKLTQPCQFDTLDQGSPGYLVFKDLLKEAQENPTVYYHLLMPIGVACLLGDQPELFNKLDNVVVLAVGMGRDQVVTYADLSTNSVQLFGFNALNVINAPANFKGNVGVVSKPNGSAAAAVAVATLLDVTEEEFNSL